MRVLVACEFSGIVRDAFRERGHEAWSCDLLPCESSNDFHIQGDVFKWAVNFRPWDLLIAFPPCTHLAVSGARWFKDKQNEQQDAIAFFLALALVPVRRIAIENPIGIMSTHYRKPDQIIQPHQFGVPEFKATCLWLKALPLLLPSNPLKSPERNSAEWKQWNRVHRCPPGVDRWKERSRTFPEIANQMAIQWGGL
jgi:site-specific DNA-cytosine methylase